MTNPIKRLYCDIEVSPNVVLAWRAGFSLDISHDSIVKERKIICIAYKWKGQGDVNILVWDEKQDDKLLLEKFIALAGEADELVGHFGNGFDFPWIRTRCLIHGLPAIPIYKTIDTKALASKYFYFNSNKLDYISKVLGFGGKIKVDFDLWKSIVLDKDPDALKKMCEYCGVDVVKLEQVFDAMESYVDARSHAGVLAGGDKWTCPHCASDSVSHDKKRATSRGTIQHQMRCKKCFGYFTIDNLSYNRYLESKK